MKFQILKVLCDVYPKIRSPTVDNFFLNIAVNVYKNYGDDDEDRDEDFGARAGVKKTTATITAVLRRSDRDYPTPPARNLLTSTATSSVSSLSLLLKENRDI